ncbi:MAG: hypothetical protein AAF645_03485 [Myxococcota bacterium]
MPRSLRMGRWIRYAMVYGFAAALTPLSAAADVPARPDAPSNDAQSESPEAQGASAPAAPTGYGGQLAPEAYYGDAEGEERQHRLGLPGNWRLSVGFHAGLTGRAEFLDESRVSYETDLAPAYGVDVQVQKPLLKYVLVGVDLFYRSLGLTGVEGRIRMLSADLLVGLRYAFRFDSVAIEPFVSVGVGIALLPRGAPLHASDGEFGVDVFSRAGLQVWVTNHFGAYLAAGARNTTFWVGETVTITQHSLEVGVVVRARRSRRSTRSRRLPT